jgi:hypothetical protein
LQQNDADGPESHSPKNSELATLLTGGRRYR